VNQIQNGLSVDVEDYFHVSNFASVIPQASWEKFPQRVEQNTAFLLQLFAEKQVKATFFILGWVAKKYPGLVKKIQTQGHEIGCHSAEHRLIYDQTPAEFQADVHQAKAALEDIIGQPVYGYRAPSYSITKDSLWALDILIQEGFAYDSSIFPVRHHRYGILDAPRHAHWITRPVGRIMEFPPATWKLGKMQLPIAGGGYFRLYPYWITRKGLRKTNQEGHSFVFYLHPWEIDPQQPRIKQASFFSKFRHYVGLGSTAAKLRHLTQDFAFTNLYSLIPTISS